MHKVPSRQTTRMQRGLPMYDPERPYQDPQDEHMQRPQTNRSMMLPIVIGITVVAILLCVIAIVLLTKPTTTNNDSNLVSGSVAVERTGGKAVESAKGGKVVLAFDSNGADSGTMESIEAEAGDTVTLPKCSFTHEGYKFEAWLDAKGTKYDPGDTLTLNDDVTLCATWAAITAEEQGSAPQSTTDGNAAPASEPASTATTAAPASSSASTFSRKWSGTYIGTSSYVGGDHHISRAVAFNFTTVTDSGYLEGVCYVGTDDTGAGETWGTCYVSGNVDWSTGAISFQGTGWIDQGGLGDLRKYSGTVDFTSQTMGGTAWDLSTGLYETPWNVQAVSQISIWQNGNLTTV